MNKAPSPLPVWSNDISNLRSQLGLSQAAFGQRLHYSAMAVSRWERGTNEPTGVCYISLGNLAGEPKCWKFWARAGLNASTRGRMFPSAYAVSHKAEFPEFEIVVAGPGTTKKRRLKKKAQLVALPLLPLHAGTHGEKGDADIDFEHVTAENVIAAPLAWCPHPDETSCLKVKGSSMDPTICDGDIIAVDSAQSDASKLGGKIVVAWHQEQGLVVSRFLNIEGLHLLQSDNKNHEPVSLKNDHKWQIVGKVLWSIHAAP